MTVSPPPTPHPGVNSYYCIQCILRWALTDPMFDRVKVPPDKWSGDNFPLSPSWWSLLSSTAISNTDLFWTFLIFGTNKPCWVSMATPILWEPWKIYTNKCSVQSSENGQSICLLESWFPLHCMMWKLNVQPLNVLQNFFPESITTF